MFIFTEVWFIWFFILFFVFLSFYGLSTQNQISARTLPKSGPETRVGFWPPPRPPALTHVAGATTNVLFQLPHGRGG